MAKSTKSTKPATRVVSSARDRASKTAPVAAPDVTRQDIARRAYELYIGRACEHGHDLDDWLRAERELRDARDSSDM